MLVWNVSQFWKFPHGLETPESLTQQVYESMQGSANWQVYTCWSYYIVGQWLWIYSKPYVGWDYTYWLPASLYLIFLLESQNTFSSSLVSVLI